MTATTLVDVATARSGDKADLLTLSVFACNGVIYQALRRELTSERVLALFGELVTGAADRYEVDNLEAVHFVLHGALGGGAARSLRSDQLGKSYGALVLRMRIDLSDKELASL